MPTKSTSGSVAFFAPCSPMMVLYLQSRLSEVGTVGNRFDDKLLDGADLVLRRDFERRGGNDVRRADRFVFAAGQYVLKDGFLLFQQSARVDKILPGGEYFRV